MIYFDKYTDKIRKEVLLETGYDLSKNTINRILKFILLNISFEIKDLKQVTLPGIKLLPNYQLLNAYFKRWPKADIVKPSRYFGLIKVRKNLKYLSSIRREYPKI